MSTTRLPGTWRFQIHSDITALETDWKALEESGCCTMFQTYDWLSVWYEVTTRHNAAEPVIMTASRAGADAPDVILPLCRWKLGSLTLLTFADMGVSDYSAPLFRPGCFEDARAVRHLVREISELFAGSSDAILFDKLVPVVGEKPNPLVQLGGVKRSVDCIWGVDLQPGSTEPPAAIPAGLLASTNKRRAQLARKFDRQVTWDEDPERLPGLFDELVAIRSRRYERIDREDLLDEPLWHDFYRTLLSRQHRGIRPVITRIAVDGRVIATFMGIGHRGSMHYLLPTFVMEKWNRYTPGFQLILEGMEQCQQRGYRFFDFTIGNEPYKEAFGARPQPLYSAHIPMSARGHQARIAWLLRNEVRKRPLLKAVIRKLIPQRLSA